MKKKTLKKGFLYFLASCMFLTMFGCDGASASNDSSDDFSSLENSSSDSVVTPVTYTVTFVDGLNVYTRTYNENEIVEIPTHNTYTKYDFECWTANGEIYDFSKPIQSDLTLKASYKANQNVQLFNPSLLFNDCEYGKQEYVMAENAVKLTTHRGDTDMYANFDVAGIPSDYYIYEVKIDSQSFRTLDNVRVDAPELIDNKHYTSFRALVYDSISLDNIMYGELKYDEYITVIVKNPLPEDGKITVRTSNVQATIYDILSWTHSGVTYDLYYRNAHVPEGMSGLRFANVENVFTTIRSLKKTSPSSANYEKYIQMVIDAYKTLDAQQKQYVLNWTDFTALYKAYYGTELDLDNI